MRKRAIQISVTDNCPIGHKEKNNGKRRQVAFVARGIRIIVLGMVRDIYDCKVKGKWIRGVVAGWTGS